MTNNEKLARLLGFTAIYDGLLYYIIDPAGQVYINPKGSSYCQTAEKAWLEHAPDWEAEHDGLPHLSRWCWPVLKEKDLMDKFLILCFGGDLTKMSTISAHITLYRCFMTDPKGQGKAAIQVLEQGGGE